MKGFSRNALQEWRGELYQGDKRERDIEREERSPLLTVKTVECRQSFLFKLRLDTHPLKKKKI